ncbi:hypothetical protein OAK87_00610 [bacterium]|nr:hypothetical protein [bacterium]
MNPTNEGPEGPTIEEIENHQRDTAARGLAQRHREQDEQQDDSNLGLQIELNRVQQKLYRNEYSNSIEELALIQEAEKIAAQIVGATSTQEGAVAPSNQQTRAEWEQEYLNANPEVQEDLAYAAGTMGAALVEDLNSNLDSEDELERTTALDVVKNLRKTPEYFASRQDSNGISPDVEASIAAEFGDEVASQISILGNSLAQGLIKPSEAIRTASGNVNLLRALTEGARKGLFRIAL